MLKDILTQYPALRFRVYVGYALVGLVLGATQVGYAAAEAGQPVALTVALAVFAFLGTAFGVTAAGNVSKTATTTAYVGEHRRADGGQVSGSLVLAVALGVLVAWLLIQVLQLLF